MTWSDSLLYDWDPDTLTGADLSAVASFPDSVGAVAAAQATSAQRPLLRTVAGGAGVNGHQALEFQGNHFLSLSGAALAMAQNVGTLAVFMVIKTLAGAVTGTRTLFALSNGTATTSGRAGLYQRGGTTGGPQVGGRRLDANSFQGVEATTPIGTSTLALLHGRFNWTGAQAAVYQDGTSVASTSAFQTAGSTSNTVSLSGAIGARSDGGAERASFQLVRMLVYRDADAAKRAEVDTYLADQYGLTVADYITAAVGSAAGAISWSGTAAGARKPVGAAAGAVAWSGTAAGRRVPAGQAVGSVTWSGTSAGSRAPKGAAAGGITWSGAAAGKAVPRGAAAGAVTWSGTTAGKRPPKGAATGAVTWSGTAVGKRTPKGAASASVTWSSTSAGSTPHRGTGAGAVNWAGTAQGSTPRRGSASGGIAWVGAAAGRATRRGATAGGITWSGTAAGVTPTVGVKDGSASGSIAWSGTAAGKRSPKGSAAGSVAWSATSSGSTTRRGAAAGSINWTASSAGSTPRRGIASGGITWAAAAAGETPTVPVMAGQAVGAVTWSAWAAGSVQRRGSATGAITWVGAASSRQLAAPMPGIRNATGHLRTTTTTARLRGTDGKAHLR